MHPRLGLRDAAAELTQEFIRQSVLDRNLLQSVSPDRGRFRTLLKTAIRHFLVDQHRRDSAIRRGGAATTSGGAALEQFEPVQGDDPSRAFERQWAAAILTRAVEHLESDCNACGQERDWRAFRVAVIDPIIGQTKPPSLERVAETIGADSPTQVSSQLQTIRRKFRRTLLAVIADTIDNPSDAPDEFARIRRRMAAIPAESRSAFVPM